MTSWKKLIGVTFVALVFCLPLSVGVTAFTGMIKPVDVEDYPNGSRYTTLYRDNYLGRIDKSGEGWGRHPGVDIGVHSGTEVRAIYDGIVIIVDTNTGWGGRIVIQHGSDSDPIPDVPSGILYSTYAHLRAVYVSKGNRVYKGDIIGASGGDPKTDLHPGESSGSHLHFQIDTFGHTPPWFPSKNWPLWAKDTSPFAWKRGPSTVNIPDDWEKCDANDNAPGDIYYSATNRAQPTYPVDAISYRANLFAVRDFTLNPLIFVQNHQEPTSEEPAIYIYPRNLDHELRWTMYSLGGSIAWSSCVSGTVLGTSFGWLWRRPRSSGRSMS